MKETLTSSNACHMLYQDDNAGWSWDGAKAMIEYLEQLEEDLGVDIEFDPVAIRCEYTEYETAQEVLENYSPDFDYDEDDDDDERETAAIEWLSNRTTVIVFTSGVIIEDF